MSGFFIFGRKIMKEQNNTQAKRNIKKTKADLYESFYDGE
jgi:hypothetical protein